jgi:hypothetical protein
MWFVNANYLPLKIKVQTNELASFWILVGLCPTYMVFGLKSPSFLGMSSEPNSGINLILN